jgi:hypothetical protein
MSKSLRLRGKCVNNSIRVCVVDGLSYHILSWFGMFYRKNNVVLTFRLRYAVGHV